MLMMIDMVCVCVCNLLVQIYPSRQYTYIVIHLMHQTKKIRYNIKLNIFPLKIKYFAMTMIKSCISLYTSTSVLCAAIFLSLNKVCRKNKQYAICIQRGKQVVENMK